MAHHANLVNLALTLINQKLLLKRKLSSIHVLQVMFKEKEKEKKKSIDVSSCSIPKKVAVLNNYTADVKLST